MKLRGDILLEFVKRTDSRYQEIRNKHYVENKGTHGQQLHFLIWHRGNLVGIISGASSVYAVASRDRFFNIPKDRKQRQSLYLPAIINNTVFRLEHHAPNLATQSMRRFREVSATLWEELYGVPVIGFETFVVETEWRKGTLYKADNWTLVGRTSGSTKSHKGLKAKSQRQDTIPKLVYCRWVKQKEVIPTTEYISSWRGETEEEKQRAKKIASLKKEWLGRMF